MADKKYTYTGPLTGVTIGDRNVPLAPGAEVSLPEDHPYVKRLVALKRLTEAPNNQASSAKRKALEVQNAS